ncbi:MAG: SatD family protein, partial [Nocardioides sp.]
TLVALGGLALREFERTAGDEFQGLLVEPEHVTTAIDELLRHRRWNLGIGIGEVDDPLPESVRAGRGPAYLFAREAVTTAKSSPWNLRVVGADAYHCRQLETVLGLWASVMSRRTPRGWEVVDLVSQGLTYQDAGHKLGITQSAVSQRAQAAGVIEGRRARELVVQMIETLLTGNTSPGDTSPGTTRRRDDA